MTRATRLTPAILRTQRTDWLAKRLAEDRANSLSAAILPRFQERAARFCVMIKAELRRRGHHDDDCYCTSCWHCGVERQKEGYTGPCNALLSDGEPCECVCVQFFSDVEDDEEDPGATRQPVRDPALRRRLTKERAQLLDERGKLLREYLRARLELTNRIEEIDGLL